MSGEIHQRNLQPCSSSVAANGDFMREQGGGVADPTFWDKVVIYGSSLAAWLSGEAGRAAAAGALGGLHRWFMSERRRLRDGLIAVTSGAICAMYLGPVVVALLDSAGLSLAPGPDVDRAAGYLAGLLGMSLAKILVGVVEAQVARLAGERRHDK